MIKMSILTVTLNPCVDKTVTVDKFLYGGLNRVKSVSTVLAGKGINVSSVLYKSGVDTFATGFMGKTRETADFGCEFVRVNGNLRTNMKIVDAENGITTEINEKGFEIDGEKLKEFECLYKKLLDKCEIAVISGSMPMGVPSCFYAQLIKIAKEKNVKTILDCDGESFSCGIKAVPYAIKPNISELEEYFGEKLDTDEKIKCAVKSLLELGIEIVAVSMGKDGSYFFDREASVRAIPFDIEVKSTVGAGDSMVAAMAYGIERGYGLSHIAALSTAMGTLTASLEGTAFVSLSEAERMSKVIKTEIR